MNTKGKKNNDWVFRNGAGMIGEENFCFTSLKYKEIIRFDEVVHLYITKNRHLYSWLFLVFVCFFLYYLFFIVNVKSGISLLFYPLIILVIYLFFKFPVYQSYIRLKSRSGINGKFVIPKQMMINHVELVVMVRKILKTKDKKGSMNILMMDIDG
jgi:hypothetical protein